MYYQSFIENTNSILSILGRKKFNENLVLYKTIERAKAKEDYH